MKLFQFFAYLSTGMTYLLIFIGGLVRVSGAGMGCPDWPKCFDRWIPPTNIDQLPEHIDPSKFNIVLAWIEYSNARTMLSYSENEATIAQELLSIAQKERAADQTDAAAVLSAEETLESALKDLSDDSMSLVTSVYEILDVINLLEPSMIENTKVEGTFNTPS